MSEVETNFIPVDLPREGLPDLVDSKRGLTKAAQLLASGNGPVAIDAERASGFKYSQRAYLVQLRRQGSGTFLVDPTEFEDLSIIQESIQDADWILHAASQDLVCLSQLGLSPEKNLYDTELAGRLLGFPKVGLGTLVENHLGFSLAKEHSAADWSARPLPDEWLAYAALDVEFLIELWDVLHDQLQEQNKYEWAIEEFTHVKTNTVQVTRQDPWRRLSGIHKLKDRRQLAIARSLWFARDELARNLDVASGRVINDGHLLEMATQANWEQVMALPLSKMRNFQRNVKVWQQAFSEGVTADPAELPELKIKSDSPPHPRSWQTRHPDLFANLEAIRTQLMHLASEILIPVENLISPETIRKVVWHKPKDLNDLNQLFIENKVRNWQRNLVERILIDVLKLN